MNLNLQLPDWAQILFQPARYKVAYGGRGSGKSYACADALIVKSCSKQERILCAREVQKSIRDSSKRVIEDRIKEHGLEHLFDIQRDVIISTETGSEFLFKGLLNLTVDNIKSLEGVTIAWVEEANTISQKSIDILKPTIRKEKSEIWFSYNPCLPTDPVHDMFVMNEPPPNAIVRKVNYMHNPWFPDVLKDEMEWDRKRDPDKYNHIWLGEPVVHSEAQVFYGVWKIDHVPDPPEDTKFYFGGDFGFANDPSTLVRCWIDGRRLYVDKAAGGIGIEIDDLPAMYAKVDGSDKWQITADNSRPETISYMRRHGYKVRPSRKGSGSIEDGIEFMRNYDIIVDPSLKPVISEFLLYCYKVDKQTDEILPIIVDANNHYIDAIRYALEKARRASIAFA